MAAPLLRQNPLFAGLPADELEIVLATLPRRRLSRGEFLFHEGEYGDRCYIVLKGEVEIIQALGASEEQVIALRGPGSLIGEMALLHPEGIRSASGRIRTPTEIVELTRADFVALLQQVPALAFETILLLSRRLRESHDITTRDLGHQLAQAYEDLQQAQAKLLEREKLERDLQLAQEVQQRMLPQTLPQLGGWAFGARMLPARHVAGDFFDFIPCGDNTVAIVVADVCGKGMGSALHMSLTRGLLRAELNRAASPLEALRNVNRHLLDVNDAGLFVTVGCAIVERDSRAVTYYRAGHELPIVVEKAGETYTPARGLGHPLGLIPDPSIDIQHMTLPPGGRLFLYTDGFTEAQDAEGRFFGATRLHDVVGAMAANTPQELCERLIKHLLAFQNGAPQSDDLTVVAIQLVA